MNISRLLKVICAAWIVLTAAYAQTGTLKVYLSPPAAQSSAVAGVATETFDQLSVGVKTTAYVSAAGIGTYTGSATNPFAIMAHDEYGGATDGTHNSPTNYLAVGTESGSMNPVYLTLAQPASYFGFWWSAGDAYNRVGLYQGTTLYATFSTEDLLTFLNDGNGSITALNGQKYQTKSYFGNPNATSGGNDSGEPFVYVSFVITGATIDKLAFYNLSTVTGFESDNHSVIFSGKTVTIPTTFVPVETLNLTPTVATPAFSPAAGTYNSVQAVAITSATSGASIRYTTNGSTPSETVGTVYSTPVVVGATETIKAIAYKSGMTDSAVASAAYTINIPVVAAPAFGPAAGTYTSAQTVAITSTTSGASIRYTTDGSTPSETAGTLYSAPVAVSSTETIKAIAYKSGMTDSAVASATYTIHLPEVAAPAFSPKAGTYTSVQTVAITSTTSGASIRYTTDGSTPSETVGTLYSTPVVVGATGTIKAIAYKSGMTDSAVTSATYTINLPAPSITSLSPTSGPVGTPVTITGANFGASQGSSTVTFNGKSAGTATSWSATSIVINVPTGATTGNVVVTVGGLASNGTSFTVTVPPSITGVSPTSGPVGTPVTITGANFGASQGTSTVMFNGKSAGTATSWSATSIVVNVPTGATTGNVVVTVGGLASNGTSFTVTVAPSVTGVSPTSGPVGTPVTITGANFGASQGSSTVTFNGASAGTATSWSASSIVVNVPTGATTGNVVVTVDGLASAGVGFSVVANIYAHVRPITIDHTKIPNTDQANFPVLISGVYPFLATIANGGQVQSPSGFDIVFTTDYAGTTQLNHEIESYDPTTGTINMWVRVPLLSHTCDTVIYVTYGNAAVTTSQENKTGVWDSNYQAVWHLDETTGTTVIDSTANANGGTKVSISSPTGIPAGKIGGAQSFNGTSDFVAMPPSLTGGLSTFSLSFWAQTTDSGNSGTYWNQPQFLGDSTAGNNSGDFGVVTNSGALGMWSGLNAGGDNSFVTGSIMNDNNWHHVAAVNNGSVIHLYLDGQDTGQTLSSGLALDSYGWYLGAQHYYAGGAAFYHQGAIDEFRFSNSARSADWIVTEYRNQSSPATFAPIGPEGTISVTVCPGAAVMAGSQTQQFTAVVVNSESQAVAWSISPAGAGSVDPLSGLYNAPAAVAASQQVTVTATSQADSTASGNATVRLLPPSSVAAIRINSGGPTYVDPAGRVWLADENFTTPCGNSNTVLSFVPPAGVDGEYADSLSCGGAAPQITYQIPVPNMDYLVTLKFAEPVNSWWGPGSRVFSVAVNGQTNSVLQRVDVWANAGNAQTPWDATIPVSVNNGQISIAFTSINGSAPIISALEIVPASSIEVVPETVTLSARQTLQFTAVEPGVASPSLSWSIVPANLGTINPSTGLYTAPASIASAATVTVTAVDTGNPNTVGTAVITLSATDPNNFQALRINSGGPTYVDPAGRVWLADEDFVSCGSNYAVLSFVPPAGVDGEYADALSCGGPAPQITYQIPVPNMDYLVTLKFAEPINGWWGIGSRLFSVAVNGQTNSVLERVDVWANAGNPQTPWDTTIPVSVSNGQIAIALTSINGASPIISALEIVPASSIEVLPETVALSARQTLQFTATQPGVASPPVTWSITPADLGSIDPNTGMYTAPASIASAATVTVTAASTSNSNIQGTAVITLSPNDPNSFQALRINSGGPTYVDPAGRVWLADEDFTTTCGNSNTVLSFVPPAGVDGEYADALSCGSSTAPQIEYQIPVPNMDYLVTLKFAEPINGWWGIGSRLFSVAVNGQTNSVLERVDVWANAGGPQTPWDTAIPISVSNGQITIALTSINGAAPIISAIEIAPASSIEVLPETATLSARQTQQFTAIQPGVANPAVTWSITPANLGSISSTGLYTAPASIPVAATVTVTAALASNPNIQGTATVTLSATDPNSFQALRINSGGPTYVDPAGRVWLADEDFVSCGSNYGVLSFVPPAGVDGEYADALSCGGPAPQITYQIPVPNMDYLVTLKFAEPINGWWGIGSRLFSVAVNGQTNSVLERVDVWANAGNPQTPWDTTIPVSVNNGQIVIALTSINGASPIISALEIAPASSIEVVPETATLSARQALQFTALQPGVTNPVVTWSITPADLGTIDPNTGLYTAPASIPVAATVTVTAASTSNSNIQGTAVITLSPTDPSSFPAVRINSGGPTYVDPAGRVWLADTDVTTSCGNNNAVLSFVPPAAVDGEYADALSCGSSTAPQITYQIPVPNMDYLVTLKFAEPINSWWGIGSRLFSVAVNGQTNSVLERVDVWANAGNPQTPWETTIPISVSNGQITIALSSINGAAPIISAIEIVPASSIEVLPETATVGPTQTLQFSALAPGMANPAVTWSISPAGLGTISATGLYVAPASLPAATTVTVIATSVANPNAIGAATVNLSAANPSSFRALRINSGGPAYTDPAGRLWVADTDSTTSCSKSSSVLSFAPPAGVDGEYADALSCGSTTAPQIAYQIPVPNMDYLVTLKFAEPTNSWWGPGSRLFSVTVNGQTNPVLERVDVWVNAGGPQIPWDTTIPVSVNNGQITIAFTSINGAAPIINAIQIMPQGGVDIQPPSANLWPSQTQQFNAWVADPANPGIAWTLTPADAGSITASGLYTAPATIPATQSVTLTATDQANPSWSQTATVNLYPPTVLMVFPSSANLTAGQTQQFAADNGAASVTWSLSPANAGSISASGLYTAPSIVVASQTITLTATAANGSTATAVINLLPSAAISVAPATATLGPSESQQLAATVAGTWNTAVNWSINPAGVGSITATGLYTAPASIVATTNVAIMATSAAVPGASATAVLTLLPASALVPVAVTPSNASLTSGQTQQFSATVSGASSTAVTWSIIPNVGSISSSGLYTAPANIALPQTITVQAASVANAGSFGTATLLVAPAPTNNYSYRRAIVIDHTKVPNTDQANFPVLITGTYSYLATVANGGHVDSSNGYDIVFSSDCAGLNQLDHEIGSYNSTTGTVSFWVLLPLVSHTVDTVFYMSYGNSSITTSQENRSAVDAARNPSTTHSADWTATAANNQNSPSAFYTIYPENTNSIDVPSVTLSGGQTQQFLPLFTVTAGATTANPLVPLGNSLTPSPAESVAINGNYAYVCDNNEVSVFDVTSPANPLFLGAVLAADMSDAGEARCSIQNRATTGPVLLAFVDSGASWLAGSPAFLAFGLENPTAPQLIAETGISKRFFNRPEYSTDGNTAFVPTEAVTSMFSFWTGQYGDVVAVDVGNLSAPAVLDTLEPPIDSTLGGANPVFGVALANPTTLLAGSSTSTGAANNGTGELVVVDVTNPKAMSIVSTVPVPNTVQTYTPVLQGNVAVALGDTGGWVFTSFQGNLTLTTFDITNLRSPAVLANIVLPYTSFWPGPAVAIGPNLSLFGGVQDNSGNNLVLLVDTTNPLVPVVTPYTVPAAVSGMTVTGNLLHVTAGAAGYAIFQIPGVTNSQYQLTGNCNGPFNWTLSPASLGTLSASGLYTAPAGIAPGEAVAVTVTSQVDSTQTASSAVNLTSSGLIISLNTSTPGPYVVGGSASFNASVTSGGVPVSGVTVTLAVTGANSATTTAVTNSSGVAQLSYTGSARGTDSLRASADSYTSNILPALWVSPATAFSTTPVTGEFFTSTSCPSGCEAFSTTLGTVPTFAQQFPDLMFNPPGTTLATRSFADTILGPTGASTGTILAQGNGYLAGAGQMTGFSAVFTGNFVVAQAGSFTINVTSQDGFIFGIGNGASRVSGVNTNSPASGLTPFHSYPVMGANNGVSTGAAAPIVVTFPAPGSYPYEFDYKSGTGGPLSFTVTFAQGSNAATSLGPLDSLVLTSNTASPVAGQPASFTVKATDETGAPIASLPIAVSVVGGAPQTLNATTNASGVATVSYTETTAMTDLLQASALVNGLQLVSAETAVTWAASSQSPQAPQITVDGTQSLTLPTVGSYTATVTDPRAPAGGAITVNWAQTGGPAAVTFSAPQGLTTTVTFPVQGIYMLEITATDSLGTRTLQFGPITVNPAVTLTTSSGWILSPVDHTQVTGLVPVVLIPTETLVSGTLSYYPTANPSAVTILNANTTGAGTLATLDTTVLPNGSYYIYLNATDTKGVSTASGVDILVGGDYKPGRFTSTVTDLVVPAPGMPIQISRTYDSLVRSTSSDFGYGWTLGVNVQLDVSADNDVTLTINGQRRTFYFTPYGHSMLGLEVGLGVQSPWTAAYTPEPGLHGTLNVWSGGSAMIASNTGCLFDWLLPYGNSFFCYENAGTFSPGGYVYTDPYGRVYTISATGGLQSVQDVAGNAITITPDGITSTNGLNVPFVRDTLGRITQITDTLGNHYNYAYDASGNLASVTYPGVATPAQYTYDPTHLYTGGTDERGNPMSSATYDSSGRLQTVTRHPDPATTYKTSYNYDIADQVPVNYPDGTTAMGYTTTTTNPADANGNVGTVTQVYDFYGKLISSTDPLSRTTLNKYDSNHNLTGVTDPLGHTTTYTYDSNGNKTSVTYPATPTSVNTTRYTVFNQFGLGTQVTDELGNVHTMSYDSNSWPKLVSDAIGPLASFTANSNGTLAFKAVGYDLTVTPATATGYTYDAYGNPAGQTDALGRQTKYTYDTLGRLASTTTPAGGTTTNTYNALGHLTNVAAPLGRTTSFTYDLNGNKIASTDADGHTTTYTYDGLNRLSQTTYPASPATYTTYTYDFRNNVIDTTDQAGHITHNVYDLAGRLTSTTTANGTLQAATTSYTYYNDGRKATRTDANNNTTAYNYDPAGRMTSVVDPQKGVTQLVYDDIGNRVQVTDPKGHVTKQRYDVRRRLTQTTFDDGTTILYSYDGPSHLTGFTDQADNTVNYTYDYTNQLTSVVQAASPDPRNTTSYAYDPDGNLTKLTDANSHTTTNAFDLLDQLSQEIMPAGQQQTRTYDAAGNLQTLTDYNGRTTTYAYDSLDRLTSRTADASLPDVPETFTYTPTGKRATMTDASGTTYYTYDAQDRLQTKVTPQGTLTYAYDLAGNVTSMTSSNTNGASVVYTYDSLNRLSTIVDNNLHLPGGQNTTTYSYDPAYNLATVVYPSGLQSTFTYDDLNRLKSLDASKAGYSYSLGPTGNRSAAVESSGRTVNWTYDGIYRLNDEIIGQAPNSKDGSVGYGLDPVGNRLSQTSTLPGIPTGSFSYDPDDRLDTETYDANGNTLTSGGNTFAYDFENRLKSMNNGAVAIQYDADGNRVAKTVNGVTTRYLVDDLNPTGYPQVVEEVVGTTAQRTYTYGLKRISQSQVIGGSWTPSFYGHDGGSSVRFLTDATGTVTDTYDYDAWGNAVNRTGSTPNAYLYRGEQYDSDLNLYYLRARYFNPLSGRFLSRDPASGHIGIPTTTNKYTYASGNPVNRVDPGGREDLFEGAIQLVRGIGLEEGVAALGCSISLYASVMDSVLNFEAPDNELGEAGEVAGKVAVCGMSLVQYAINIDPKYINNGEGRMGAASLAGGVKGFMGLGLCALQIYNFQQKFNATFNSPQGPTEAQKYAAMIDVMETEFSCTLSAFEFGFWLFGVE